MLTVNHDVFAVESDLLDGLLACPGCRGVLRPWGWARDRSIRHGSGAGRKLVSVRPRRARCTGCSGTHVLLGVELAARRADTAAVIAQALEAKSATGTGHRPIAASLDRPASTVRGWLRGFAASGSAIATAFTGLVHRDGADPAGLWPAPAPTPAGSAVAAVTAYASVLAERFAVATLAWQTAGLVAAGPFFFSTARWHGHLQHEMALMPGPRVGQSGKSTG